MLHILYLEPDQFIFQKCLSSPPKSYFKKIVFGAESDKFKLPGKFTDLEKFKQRFSALTAHHPKLFGAGGTSKVLTGAVGD